MRRYAITMLLVTVSLSTPHAQDAMTREQRVLDLTQLASFYAKNYAPYEWKRDTSGFDLLRLTPWLSRIWRADDLEFQEALIEYVASLNDAHDLIAFPTNFSASVGLSVDIYDGKVLIDGINRFTLPVAQFPFAIGDELVSVDGRSVQQLIQSFRKYAIAANRRSTDRMAASRIVSRSQQIMPHLPDIGNSARVVIRLAATGATSTFDIPWVKTGIPITSQGPVPTPGLGPGRLSMQPEGLAATPDAAAGAEGSSVFQLADLAAADNTLPSYMDPVRALLNAGVSKDYFSVLGFGGRFPIYAPPPGFVVRPVPTGQPAFFLSGTYVANGVRIGLIRIPTMSPPNVAIALQQLDQEIAFFNANTDALIVDVMRNPGGLISFVEAISQRFIPVPFRSMGFEIRATAAWVFSFASQLTFARLSNAPPAVIENLQRNFDEVLRAFNEKRGRSAPVSLNATGSLTLEPSPIAYTKPLMVLTDEFSASGADMFPAIIQDNGRGPIFGMRTMGAGGSVVGFNGTAFTESFFRITVSLMNRGTLIQTPEFPPAPYIENIGVRPNIVVDYMTRDNLVGGGGPFVQAFTQAIVNLAQTTTTH
jgi:peptidase S41-like protein/PDZ domain-containing protein